jgi:hypothetical protein
MELSFELKEVWASKRVAVAERPFTTDYISSLGTTPTSGTPIPWRPFDVFQLPQLKYDLSCRYSQCTA